MRTLPRLSTMLLAAAVGVLTPLSGVAVADAPDFPTVVRDGTWYLREAQTAGGATASWTFGTESDVPLLGDWDDDGVATSGVYRDGSWYLTNDPAGGAAEISFYYGGRPGDFPLVGDWDGDGIDTVGVIRGGTWHLVNAFRGGTADLTFTYGRVAPRGDDIPLVGDWDGNRTDTVGIVRDGTWHLRNANEGGPGEEVFVYGRVGPRGDDLAVTGDWDDDGIDTVGVVRGNAWYLRNTNSPGAGDVPFSYGRDDDWKSVRGGFAETTQERIFGPDDVGLSPEDAIRAWFPDQADKAVRVADCESGLVPTIVSADGRFHGLFQIAEEFHRDAFAAVTGASWDDGVLTSYYNAQYARHLYDQAGGWSPWPSCGSG